MFDAGGSDAIQRAIEQAAAGDIDQRLWAGGGERAHALAQPGGHHHGACGQHAFDVRFEAERGFAHHFTSTPWRALAGTWASNQARTGASAGWSRLAFTNSHKRGWKRG